MSAASQFAFGDILPFGIIVLNEAGEVAHSNRAAAGILRERDGLLIRSGLLVASRTVETSRLKALAAEVTAISGSAATYRAMLVSRPSSRRPFQVVVTNLAVEWMEVRKRTTVILVGDPERPVYPPHPIFRDLYRFTDAESKLAVLLMSGKSLQEAGQKFGVTIATLRTQLHRILDKTGTSRQCELIQLLLCGPINLGEL